MAGAGIKEIKNSIKSQLKVQNKLQMLWNLFLHLNLEKLEKS